MDRGTFYRRVAVGGPDECWLWQGGKYGGGTGYGAAKLPGPRRGSTTAHHVAYVLEHGPDSVPRGSVVHHRCETALCVNPAHLECLSRAEHVRLHRPRLKLAAVAVAEVRRRYPAETQEQLAAVFGVGRSQIGRIVRAEVRLDG